MPVAIQTISYTEAKKLMAAAVLSASRHDVPAAIAIVDNGGHLVLAERLEGTMQVATNIAIGKAATAVAFQRSTGAIEDVVLSGRTPMLMLNNTSVHPYVPLKGGFPIFCENEIIGAIAIAGTMDAEMDEVVALEALKSF